MTLPSWRDWLFSAKAFAGAMLALWIALRMNLDRPYWAMASAYIVAQPLTGAMRSKAAYRFYGTLLGAVATLVFIPNLVDAPVLLIGALSLWIGGCVYFAVLDRTPRSYVFLLAGYSVALIGFPIVDQPGTVWDVVLARVEEITLGIVCTTLIGSIVFPVSLGPALSARLDNWISDAAAWTVGVLSAKPQDATMVAARRKVAGAAGEIAMLATHLAYDTSNLQTATVPVAILQQRMLLLLPVVSGMADRIRLLNENSGITTSLRAMLDRICAWIQAGHAAELSEADELHADIDAIEPAIDATADWKAVVLVGLLERLRELTDLVHDIMALRRQIRAGEQKLARLTFAQGETIQTLHHRDHLMALYSAFATILAIGLVSAFWIGTAWPEGAGAASLAAIACAFFAAQDDPVPSMVGFLLAAVIALIIDAIYLFAILPRAQNFEMLVLAFAPVFLILGAMTSMPATARVSGPISFIAATQLALSSSYSADFPSYVNGSLAAIFGLAGTAIIVRIVRSVSAEWTAWRLLRRNRIDIAKLAADRSSASLATFAMLMLDRLSLVVPRLAASAEGPDGAAATALADLRVGINVLGLQRVAMDLPEQLRAALHTMMDAIARHYRRRNLDQADAGLLAVIDRAIAAVVEDPAGMSRELLLQLSGIRRGLFPNAAPYTRETALELGQQLVAGTK
ncbi:MAG TPA: FUSC family protein [Acetobacteraceae bacterium]|nr:FUSC family protein [Acetobacteraceae bacterium]